MHARCLMTGYDVSDFLTTCHFLSRNR